MALPVSGNISISDINTELGVSASNNSSLKDLADGTIATLNTHNDLTNIEATPYRLSDWYGYDHSAGGDLPSVLTLAATSVTYNSARLNGNVTDAGDGSFEERGFQLEELSDTWGTSADIAVAGSTGAYNYDKAGLSPDTKYKFRAYARNQYGTSFGEVYYFQTVNPS